MRDEKGNVIYKTTTPDAVIAKGVLFYPKTDIIFFYLSLFEAFYVYEY